MSGEPSFRARVISALAGGNDGLRSQLVRFFSNPAGYIAGIIATYIVSSVFNVFEYIAGSILLVFDYLTNSVNVTTANFANGLRLVFVDLLVFLRELTAILAAVTASAGPAAPILAVAVAAIGLVIAWEVAKRLPGWLWKLYQIIPGT